MFKWCGATKHVQLVTQIEYQLTTFKLASPSELKKLNKMVS